MKWMVGALWAAAVSFAASIACFRAQADDADAEEVAVS